MGLVNKWQSLGFVFVADKQSDWCYSHASYPVAVTEGEHLSILFSPRDRNNKSHIGRLLLNLNGDNFSVASLDEKPLLSPGVRGAFDDAGVTIGSAIRDDAGLWRLYYLGWSLGVSVPFTNFIGLATTPSLITPAKRHSPAPVIGRSKHDPYSVGYPWVIKDGIYKIWYGSHRCWGPKDLEMEHVIHHATSINGFEWEQPANPVAVDMAGGEEYAVSRPCVIKTKRGYHMWYARRYAYYRAGYAFSENGTEWIRADDDFIFDGRSDWDNESISYFSVFEWQKNFYMLYNGNGYGRTGFGIARLVHGVL